VPKICRNFSNKRSQSVRFSINCIKLYLFQDKIIGTSEKNPQLEISWLKPIKPYLKITLKSRETVL
jgi:hypothetical protein